MVIVVTLVIRQNPLLSDNRAVEIKMDDKLDIQTDIIISGIKLLVALLLCLL